MQREKVATYVFPASTLTLQGKLGEEKTCLDIQLHSIKWPIFCMFRALGGRGEFLELRCELIYVSLQARCL